MIPAIDRIVDASYLTGLVDRSTDDLRTMRTECADVENGVSYVRRLAQGRLDVVNAETKRRSAGDGGSASDLVDNLAAVLADGMSAPGSGRAAQELEPPERIVAPLSERLDEVAGVSVISDVADLDDRNMAATASALLSFEETLSHVRQELHSTIDAINEQLARRYAAGEAPVGDA